MNFYLISFSASRRDLFFSHLTVIGASPTAVHLRETSVPSETVLLLKGSLKRGGTERVLHNFSYGF